MKRTTQEFISLARIVHGEKYDYSPTEYLKGAALVTIICPAHGKFEQSAANHLAGKGCRKCASKDAGDRRRKSTDDFVKTARLIHGGRYDYSDCNYISSRLKVIIRCREHGPFEQMAYVHLKGGGCPSCGKVAVANSSRTSRQKFTEQAVRKYGEKFDYSHVEYTNAWTPVLIGCPTHGVFTQTPAAHLHNTKYGCPKCAGEDRTNRGRGPREPRLQDRKSTAQFIESAELKHKGKYDYSLVEYTTSTEKVTIVCRVHGEFLQDPSSHLSGRGCPKCGNERISALQRQSVESFIARARIVHGNKYGYSKVEYKTARAPVTITCPVHGDFQQSPDGHLNRGCRQCANDELPGSYSAKVLARNPALAVREAILYYLKFESSHGEDFFKVGITLKSIKQRFAGYGAAGYTYTVIGAKKLPLIEAFEIEQELLSNHVKAHRYSPLRGNRERTSKFGGRTECFSVELPPKLAAVFCESV